MSIERNEMKYYKLNIKRSHSIKAMKEVETKLHVCRTDLGIGLRHAARVVINWSYGQ